MIPITDSLEMVAYRWMCLSIGFKENRSHAAIGLCDARKIRCTPRNCQLGGDGASACKAKVPTWSRFRPNLNSDPFMCTSDSLALRCGSALVAVMRGPSLGYPGSRGLGSGSLDRRPIGASVANPREDATWRCFRARGPRPVVRNCHARSS